MQETVFHVLLEGRKLGPYDRRTIVGMRIKKTLENAHLLISQDGRQLTVGELVASRPRESTFQPTRSGSYSVVQATYPASLLKVEDGGIAVPPFRDEIELRVQTDALRLAGRARGRFGWSEREVRVKLPMEDIVHARVRGGVVDLWVRAASGAEALQRITLELFTPEAAGELVEWLPHAVPWPGADSQPAALGGGARKLPVVWIAVVGTAVAVGGVLLYLLSRRVF